MTNGFFFSNYHGPKNNQFENMLRFQQLFYWNTRPIQTRIKAKIKKTSQIFSDMHFNKR